MTTKGPTVSGEPPRGRGWVFYYDGACGFCTRAVRWLSRADLLRRIDWVPYQSLDSPPKGLSWNDLDRSAYLDTGRGLHEGFYAFRMLTLRLIPLVPLAPVLWLPWVAPTGVRVYRWVARNRNRLGNLRIPRPWPTRRTRPSDQP